MPALTIAAEAGITGTRIAAICRQHGIPTPPRGHWAKLAAGKRDPQPPLTNSETDYEIKIGPPVAVLAYTALTPARRT